MFDKVEGESLLDWVIRTGDIQECARRMAQLHQEILRGDAPGLEDYRESLRSHMAKARVGSVGSQQTVIAGTRAGGTAGRDMWKRSIEILDTLPPGDTFCHGDYHPGNVLICGSDEGGPCLMAIDFMNACRGPYLYDIARSVFLLEHSPAPSNLEGSGAEAVLASRAALTDLYLAEMGVAREMVRNYLLAIVSARMGECPEEENLPAVWEILAARS